MGSLEVAEGAIPHKTCRVRDLSLRHLSKLLKFHLLFPHSTKLIKEEGEIIIINSQGEASEEEEAEVQLAGKQIHRLHLRVSHLLTYSRIRHKFSAILQDLKCRELKVPICRLTMMLTCPTTLLCLQLALLEEAKDSHQHS